MSRKGNCWDNAVAESFFATLKKDLIHRRSWFSKSDTIAAINDYILNFYNRRRRHSAIGFKSPADYERLTMVSMAA
jgi:transposase InsO family protein